MAKDGNWKFSGAGSDFESKSGGQGWQYMSGGIAELVAKQIAAGKSKKKKKKEKKKKKK